MTREELIAALVVERFGAPRPRPRPARQRPASRGAGIPDQQTTTLYLRQLRGYGWTPEQIAATTGVPVAEVRRRLARAAAADRSTP